MAPELRKRSKSQTAQPAAAKPAAVKKAKVTTKRQAAEDASPVSSKKQKTVKEVKSTKPAATETKPARVIKETKKKVTKTKPVEAVEEPAEEIVTEEAEESIIPIDDEEASGSDDENDDEIDAEIQALAAGLDPEDDDGRTSGAAGYKAGQDVGKIPEKLSKKERKALAAQNTKQEPGVIYVGRLPHGFYEHELKGYFGQFGRVTRLRLSRNKKTGKSKHYAFIEFAEESTAQIAAKTMDKYLLFGHILTVKFVDKEQLHADIWKGANRRFKKTPWAKIAGNKLARPVSESAWEDRIEKEKLRRASRAEKLKELGYEYEPPALKAAPAPLPIEISPPEAVEAPAEEKNGAPEVVAEVETEEVVEAVKPAKAKKSKAAKGKKATKA